MVELLLITHTFLFNRVDHNHLDIKKLTTQFYIIQYYSTFLFLKFTRALHGYKAYIDNKHLNKFQKS